MPPPTAHKLSSIVRSPSSLRMLWLFAIEESSFVGPSRGVEGYLVELEGVEPTAFGMQIRRSPN